MFVLTIDKLDHTSFAALTGGEAYKCIGGGSINAFFNLGGEQTETAFLNLSPYSGTTYRYYAICRGASSGHCLVWGNIQNVAKDSTTNVNWTNTKTIKLDDLEALISYAKNNGLIN